MTAATHELMPLLRLDAPPVGFYEDPYPLYQRLRTTAPIADDGKGGLLLTRHADLSEVYRDTARFVSDKRAEFAPKFGPSPLLEHHTTSLVFNDDPYHAHVRRRLVGALTPRAVSTLGAKLATHCDTLVDYLVQAGGGDAIEGFAAAIPVRVIGDMLGLPESDRKELRSWSLAILGALEPALNPQQQMRGNSAVKEFAAFMGDLIAARRRRPGDPETDLLTRLIAGDPPLTDMELIHNAIFLLNAGHETTSNLIGNALHILATTPGVHPDGTGIDTFVEEVIRFESPNQLGNRRAATNTAIAGVPVSAGTSLTLIIGAANRDPEVFEEPERFIAARSPNRHLAFGAGNHQCAGLSLARLEARVALDSWRRGIPRFALAAPPSRQHRVRFRGFETLPVVI